MTATARSRFDKALKSGHLKLPHKFVNAGVDPSFDARTLSHYAEALAGGEQDVDRFIDIWSEKWSIHANMDY